MYFFFCFLGFASNNFAIHKDIRAVVNSKKVDKNYMKEVSAESQRKFVVVFFSVRIGKRKGKVRWSYIY